jgi:hypothetical protein
MRFTRGMRYTRGKGRDKAEGRGWVAAREENSIGGKHKRGESGEKDGRWIFSSTRMRVLY